MARALVVSLVAKNGLWGGMYRHFYEIFMGGAAVLINGTFHQAIRVRMLVV